jgi:hypothetical protein
MDQQVGVAVIAHMAAVGDGRRDDQSDEPPNDAARAETPRRPFVRENVAAIKQFHY